MQELWRLVLFGRPLSTSEELQHRLNKLQALAVFSSDALSSVAYATEEILLVLVVAGMGALRLSLPIAGVIVAMLLMVASSYHQTIHGYPSGGGAYIVAYDNLGKWPGLVAAAALLIDYVLTVAVSITAGVAAITSAFPQMLPWRILLALVAVALIAWANLRGVRESGTAFAIPTYGFVVLMLGLIAVGVIRWLTGALPPVAVPAAVVGAQPLEALGLLLVLRAFSSGCTALTGVEAISNGVPAFRKPEADNAGKTLVAMAALLAVMFLGITVLARLLQVAPSETETVISQIGRQVFGSGPLYVALQVASALILLLAANTSFADFPRLSAILSRAGFLPRQMSNLGDRLVFGNGIIVLGLLSALLITVFGGQTHRLIPLYAVGVFLSFTLSQVGMVRHWHRLHGPGWQHKAVINGVGALATAIVLAIMIVTKFVHGAWIVIVLIPTCVGLFEAISLHYRQVARQLSLAGMSASEEAPRPPTRGIPKIVVAVSGVHRGSLAALNFARALSDDITAVITDIDAQVTGEVAAKWPLWCPQVPLVVLPSPYRSTVAPLLRYLDEVDARDPDKGLAVLVLPQFVTARFWERFLHNRSAELIKQAVIYQRGPRGKDRVVIDVPYHLKD
jgi:amino acid transporter